MSEVNWLRNAQNPHVPVARLPSKSLADPFLYIPEQLASSEASERGGRGLPSALWLTTLMGRRCRQRASKPPFNVQLLPRSNPLPDAATSTPARDILVDSAIYEANSPTWLHRYQQTTGMLLGRFWFNPPSNAWPIRRTTRTTRRSQTV